MVVDVVVHVSLSVVNDYTIGVLLIMVVMSSSLSSS